MMVNLSGEPFVPRRCFDCPYCGKSNDAMKASNGQAAQPRSGMMSVCFRCARVAAVVVDGQDVSLRELTDQEVKDLPEEVVATCLKLHDFWDRHGGMRE